MKILISRDYAFTNPVGQNLRFDDGSVEWDSGCEQTTAILTAELHNGKAAKDDSGNWVPAPGPRIHNDEHEIMGFMVGLTLIGFGSDGKAMHDYTVITPTNVAFHGNGKDNVLHTPTSWSDERVALEIVSWICLGEDSGTEFPADTTPEQWQWIRSYEREAAAADIDTLIEVYDRGERNYF